MQKVTDIIELDNFSCLVYGKSGTGKTLFAAGFPPPVIFIDCDDGMLSIKTTEIIPEEAKEQIHFITIKEKYFRITGKDAKTSTAYPKVKEIINTILKTGQYESVKPKTVVLDTLTTFSEFALNAVLAPSGRLDADKVTQPEWGKQIRNISNVISKSKSFKDINFICLAHEQYQKCQHSGRIWCLPLTTGKFASRVSLYFDEMYHAVVDKEKYELLTRPSGLITARTRLNLPARMNTSYETIRNFLNNRRKENNPNGNENSIGEIDSTKETPQITNV